MLTIAVILLLFKEYNCNLVLHTNGSFEVNVFSSRKPVNTGKPPAYFDWRELDMVSPVKDQLECAACWAFSTVAGIESHLKIYLKQEETLSEQFLIDCDDAGKGCQDASIIQTFANIVTKLGGVLRSSEYFPYSHKKNECRWEPPKAGVMKYGLYPNYMWNRFPQPVPVIGFRRVYADEDEMAEFVYKYGPLTAAINSESMAKYKGGIDEPSPQDCDPEKLNHAVLIVGYKVYESDSGEQLAYWIIKNSWGTGWGDQGFYYLVRGRNACGISKDVSFPYVN